MRFLSLFSGIEAASVAWSPLGWEAVGFSEIEPFPCRLLKSHYPSVPNLGDVTKITEEQVAALGHIDLVIGGFPCQDLSIAGKRKGLHDAETGEKTRSGLFFDAMRVVGWARTHCGLRWLLCENVPGLLSSNKGRDLAAVLGEMAGCEIGVPDGGWRNSGIVLGERLVEWCVLDAQFFGVPQRRRRVFALADFGDWGSRPPVLFEPEGVRWDSAERGDDSEPDGETFGTITTRTGRTGSRCNYSCECGHCIVDKEGLPRWITEEEAELAQGFPRGYTSAGTAKARYKAIGNSMATPVVRWIGERIQRVHDSR